MGSGVVYGFSKLRPGTITDTCQEMDFDTPPCPDEWADAMYTPEEGDERSLYGQTISSTKSKIFISAPKSSTYSRQSGVIYVYEK